MTEPDFVPRASLPEPLPEPEPEPEPPDLPSPKARERAAKPRKPAPDRSPESLDTQRQAKRAYRSSALGRDSERQRRRNKTALRPFVGVDGEGAGQDEHGRQHYMLLRVGERELYTGKPLSMHDCLAHILQAPRDAILVGFAFGYDTTQMLRELSPRNVARLFQAREWGEARSPYVWLSPARDGRMIGVEYLPRNYLRVCWQTQAKRQNPDGTWREVRTTVKGSTRTVYDVFGLFQKSFVAAITAFDIGTAEERARIEANKAVRGSAQVDDEMRAYCAMECDFLARLMERFRDVSYATAIRPHSWAGAGKLSSALHRAHDTPTAAQVDAWVPEPVRAMAADAYYGGRFEISRVGAIERPVWEYDIRSAYPAAMLDLPCLEHGTWEAQTAAQLRRLNATNPAALYVAPVRFHHRQPSLEGIYPPCPVWCGLPLRHKSGRLSWPIEGNGTYWSCEIQAAQRLGATIHFRDGWRYVTQCECRPFDWIPGLYAYRKTLAGAAGDPIKLAINGLYGKLAQRIGNPRWRNLLWAGLITAMTRTRLMAAVAADPDAVVMLATDAVFSLRPLALPLSDRLGEWEEKRRPRLFVAQPGLYWGEVDAKLKLKSRGISPKFFTPLVPTFEAIWRDYAAADRAATREAAPWPPTVNIPVRLFVGLRLAHARGKPLTAGCWVENPEKPRRISLEWRGKRDAVHQWESPTHLRTWPQFGGRQLVSKTFTATDEQAVTLDLERAELDDQPDFVDLGPPS